MDVDVVRYRVLEERRPHASTQGEDVRLSAQV